jgi:hypothetical protein
MLAVARAPLGLDVVGLPAVDGATVALFRAVPWVLLAGLLGRPARAFAGGVPTAWLLSGALAGFTAEAFGLEALHPFETRLGIGSVVVACAVGAYLCARGKRASADAEHAGAREERVGIGAWFGLMAAGAGLALALRPLGLHLEHLGLRSDAETLVRGAALAGLLLAGAVAFGPLVPARARGALLPALLALAAAAAFVGVQQLGVLQDARLLDHYLRRFELDYSRIGMLGPALLLTGLVLVAPALVAGAALGAARHRVRLSAVLLGVGVGLAAWPIAVDAAAGAPQAAPAMFAADGPAWTWGRVALGTWVAAGGAIAAAWSGGRGPARVVALVLVALAAAVPWLVPRKPIWVLSPWHRVPVEPELAWYTGDGLLTVERDREGARIVTLDRRRMTPLALEERQDALRFDTAWGLLPDDVRARESVRVLLVGQMTPARAFHLRRYPNATIDHVVPWHAHRAPVDALLFQGAADPLPGRPIAPGEARARLARGSYDLVIAPPSHGPLVLPRSAARIPWAPPPAPATAGVRAPAGTVVVAWVPAAAPFADRAWTAGVVLCSRGLDDLEVGLIAGAAPEPGARGAAPWILAAGARGDAAAPLAYLRRRPGPRDDDARAAAFARLAAANAGPAGELAAALARHAAVQRPSSPFETLAMGTEIDDATLEHLGRAAAAGLDPFQRQLWEGLAATLVGKRVPDKILAHVEPLAAAHAPWATLEHAVATAYREFAMPAEAAAWLQRAVQSSSYDLTLLLEAAEWTGRAGDAAGEVALLRSALAMQPGRADVERLLAIALLRAGDPEGRARVEALLAAAPDDEELAELLQPGPHPRPEPLPPGMPDEH